MDDDTAVRKLLELIFIKRTVYHKEISTASSSLPACIETKEFAQRLHSVLATKRVIILRRWKSFFDACCLKMFTSHEMYLKYMMYLCRAEHGYYKNIFDSFISVCAVVISLTEETIRKTAINLCHLNPDIVMVFYKSVMKKKFRKSGGFQKIVEYIQTHRYLEINGPGANIALLPEVRIKMLREEYIKDQIIELIINADDIYEDYASRVLGKKCLGTISVDLPPLPSKPDLIRKLVQYKREQLEKTSDTKVKTEPVLNPERSEEILNPIFDPTTGCVEKEEEEELVLDYGVLMQAVMNYSEENPDLKTSDENNLKEHQQSQMPQTSANNLKSEHTEELSNPVIDSTTACVANEKDLAEGYNETIKAVVKHNQEKPDLKISDESTLKKADKILQNLKDDIKSLIEVLDIHDGE